MCVRACVRVNDKGWHRIEMVKGRHRKGKKEGEEMKKERKEGRKE